MHTLRTLSATRLSIATMEVIRSRLRSQPPKIGRQIRQCKFCFCTAHYSIPEIGDVCNRCYKILEQGISYGVLQTYLVLDKVDVDFADDDEDEI